MAAPFSKIDFILILNFMENELKSKDEIIEALKKYKQYSQSSETKYGKIGPGRCIGSSSSVPEKKVPGSEEDGGDYGIDPLSKLNKLIDSHRIITDGLQSQLSAVSDLCGEVSSTLTSENLKRERFEDESPLDALIFDVQSLNRQLEDLRQESQSAAMRLEEFHELNRMTRSSRRGAVLAKLISNRGKLATEMMLKCQEVNLMEKELENAKLKSKQFEEKLLRLVEGVCGPTNQKKRMKAEDTSKEMNKLILKLKLIDEENSKLMNKVIDVKNKHHHHQHHHHHHHHHQQQQQAKSSSDKDNILISNSSHHRPASASGPSSESNASSILKSPLHQQGPYLSSTAIQILQVREGDMVAPKSLQHVLSHVPSVHPMIPSNNVSLNPREVGKCTSRSDTRSTLCPSSSVVHTRSSPCRDTTSSKVINVNIVAGARFNATKESETIVFRIGEDDHSCRQKQQSRLPASERSIIVSSPMRWPACESGLTNTNFQHPEGRALQQRQHLLSPKPGGFPSARSVVMTPSGGSPSNSSQSIILQGRSQKANQLSTFKPSVSTSNSNLPSTSFS